MIDGGAVNDLTAKGGDILAHGGTINRLSVDVGYVYTS